MMDEGFTDRSCCSQRTSAAIRTPHVFKTISLLTRQITFILFYIPVCQRKEVVKWINLLYPFRGAGLA